jgi:hypothetical protein
MVAAALAAALVAAYLLLWWLPQHETDALREACITRCSFDQEQEVLGLHDEVRATGAQMLGGLILLLSAVAAWRNVMQQREGQITSRFTDAIGQLGQTHSDGNRPVIEVRMGGIFALEQIARDWPDKYHRQVFEVLTAYIRENAPLRAVPDAKKSESADPPTAVPDQEETRKPREDVQAALTVIGRRTVRPELEPERLNLAGTDLRGADLREAELQHADLRGAQLQGANLTEAQLQGAFLWDAQLQGALLWGAQLQGADLSDAQLQGANLRHAQLQEAYLTEAQLQGAFLWDAQLQGAFLARAKGLARSQLCAADFDETTVLTDEKAGRTRQQVCVEQVPVGGLL